MSYLSTLTLNTNVVKPLSLISGETRTIFGYCSCGKIGQYCANPFIEDINGRIVMQFLCEDCYSELCRDI